MTDSAVMQQTFSMAERICTLIGGDSLREVSAKLALQGVVVSAQAVQKWKKGGNVSDENIAALAAAYNSTPEYIKFGAGPPRPLSDAQIAAAELVGEIDIEPIVQEAFDFMKYKLETSPLLAKDPAAMARYFRWIETVRAQPKQKKKGST